MFERVILINDPSRKNRRSSNRMAPRVMQNLAEG